VKKFFGGGRTKGFCLIYDNEESLRKNEPAYRLKRVETEKLAPKDRKKQGKKEGRKVQKVKKHQGQKKRGTKRRQDKNLARKQNKKKK
jgi:small subunit ribosomal protein S24e